MNYNIPSDIVKDLSFDESAREQIMSGVAKLEKAVSYTLGAGGNNVVFEDSTGTPVVTKDGVTVAEAVVLEHPVEDMGAKMVREAARNTVKEAGDGTTTSTVLANALLKSMEEARRSGASVRQITLGVKNGLEKIYENLDSQAIEVTDKMVKEVAAISCNNDKELGDIIGGAYNELGKDGVVTIEKNEKNETEVEIVRGISFESNLKHFTLATNSDKSAAVYEDSVLFISMSKIEKVEKILHLIEYAMERNKAFIMISDVGDATYKNIVTNKIRNNMKVNVIDPAGFGETKADTMEDIAFLTGGKVYREEDGDDLSLFSPDMLGECESITIHKDRGTTIVIDESPEGIEERIDSVKKLIGEESKNKYIKGKLEQRLSMLVGKVGIIKVGGDSEQERKERYDRVDDAVHATKAALNGGIVSGGGVALRDASETLDMSSIGESCLKVAILTPQRVILENAGILKNEQSLIEKIISSFKKKEEIKAGYGINAVDGKTVNMVDAKIIDPLLVTKTALKNAASVALTILSAGCVISNQRLSK